MSVVRLLFGDVTPVIFGLRATEYMFAACAMLWTYDYFITLDREIVLVWPSRWSIGKVMFFINRYSPIIDIILANFILQGVRNQGNCAKLTSAAAWLFTTGTLWSEIILIMRAWAIWGGNRYVLYFLIAFKTGIFTAACILTQTFLLSITYIPIPEFLIPIFGLTCASFPKHGVLWTEFLIFMIGQAVVATLALTRGFREYRLNRNPLLGIMFHDGLLYYVYTLALCIANMLLALLAPVQWGAFLLLHLRVLSSIFSTRILLNIRGTYFRKSNNTNSTYIDNGAKSTNFVFQAGRGRGHPSRSRSTWDESTTMWTPQTDILLENIDEEDEQLPPGQGWTWSNPMQPYQNVDIEMT